MTRIVTTTYRYKPPPRKRKAVPLAGPAVVTPTRKSTTKKPEPATAPRNDNHPEPPLPKKPAIVTARRPGKRYADVPDLTPEEHQRRTDAAAALWREMVRRASSKERR